MKDQRAKYQQAYRERLKKGIQTVEPKRIRRTPEQKREDALMLIKKYNEVTKK